MYIFNLKSCLALLCGVGVISGLSAEFHNQRSSQTNPGSFDNQRSLDSSNYQRSSDASNYQTTPSYFYQDSSRDRNQSDFQRNQNNNYNQIQRDAEKQGHKRPLSYLAQARTDSPVTSDQNLKKKIEDKIGSGWFSRGYENVAVEVKNGVVSLRGTVQTRDDKEKVEKEVRNIEGVKSVNSQIGVSESNRNNNGDRNSNYDRNNNRDGNRDFSNDTFSSSADEQLNKKIRDNVSRGWLWNSYERVSLSTTNGVVTLNGEVDDRDAETKLIDEVGKIEGVKSVKSNLRIEDREDSDRE